MKNSLILLVFISFGFAESRVLLGDIVAYQIGGGGLAIVDTETGASVSDYHGIGGVLDVAFDQSTGDLYTIGSRSVVRHFRNGTTQQIASGFFSSSGRISAHNGLVAFAVGSSGPGIFDTRTNSFSDLYGSSIGGRDFEFDQVTGDLYSIGQRSVTRVTTTGEQYTIAFGFLSATGTISANNGVVAYSINGTSPSVYDTKTSQYINNYAAAGGHDYSFGTRNQDLYSIGRRAVLRSQLNGQTETLAFGFLTTHGRIAVLDTTSVPEPSSLLIVAIVALIGLFRRKRKTT